MNAISEWMGLTGSSRADYQKALLTSYILTCCDVWPLREADECGEEGLSVSWILSIRRYLDIVGLEADLYPCGSIGANRLCYQCLRAFHDDVLPAENDFVLVRQGLHRFLRLRLDDSSPSPSYLYGSHYEVTSTRGTKQSRPYRHVHVNLRHTAAALWILLAESGGVVSDSLALSVSALVAGLRDGVATGRMWDQDSYPYATFATTASALRMIREGGGDALALARACLADCTRWLLDPPCMIQDATGTFQWPTRKSEGHLHRYSHFGYLCALIQVPWLLSEPRLQSLVRWMIDNGVPSDGELGIPLMPIAHQPDPASIQGDIGATGSVAYLLLYSLQNGLGDSTWLDYCEATLPRLIGYCSARYTDPSIYSFSYTENYSKLLLLPHGELDPADLAEATDAIAKIRAAVATAAGSNFRGLDRALNKAGVPDTYAHVVEVIRGWRLLDLTDAHRGLGPAVDYWALGEFLGGLSSGLLKGFS